VVSELIKPGVRVTLVLAMLGLMFGVGCSPAPTQSAWVRSNGGLAGKQEFAKAQVALALLSGAETQAIQVSVINSDAVGAYAWPGGNVYLTRGLVELLDRQELAAALAHEIGHLIADQTLNPPSSLGGTSDNRSEISADAVGAQLLGKRGIKRDALVSMLRKVCCCPSVNSSCRRAMLERIEILSR